MMEVQLQMSELRSAEHVLERLREMMRGIINMIKHIFSVYLLHVCLSTHIYYVI